MTVTGNGFTNVDEVTVLIGGSVCSIEELSSSEVVCVTSQHAEEADVDVTATLTTEEDGAIQTTEFITSVTYSYDAATTPEVTAVSPVSGTGGDTLTVTGDLFSTTADENIVTVGGKKFV